jgi:hypothetical protein
MGVRNGVMRRRFLQNLSVTRRQSVHLFCTLKTFVMKAAVEPVFTVRCLEGRWL